MPTEDLQPFLEIVRAALSHTAPHTVQERQLFAQRRVLLELIWHNMVFGHQAPGASPFAARPPAGPWRRAARSVAS